ncbi:MAG: hypothetical protein AB1586_21255 [Pseudomonadota bacterium]|jgi:hypothetical protein
MKLDGRIKSGHDAEGYGTLSAPTNSHVTAFGFAGANRKPDNEDSQCRSIDAIS